jgi:DNA polymerase III sliding clamp (beta) subunit (PCNA family)
LDTIKIPMDQTIFLEAIRRVCRATGNSNSQEGFGDVRLKGIDNNYILEGTCGSLSITTRIPGKVEGESSYVFPADLLKEMVSLVPSGPMSLIIKEKEAVLKWDSGSFKIPVKSSFGFPSIYDTITDKADSFKIGHKRLKRAIKQVVPIVQQNVQFPYLSGVNFFTEGAFITVEGSDRASLVKNKIPLEEELKDNFKFLILPEGLKELERLLSDDDDEDCGILVKDNLVRFTVGVSQVIVPRMSQEFPDTETLINNLPHKGDISILVTREDLLLELRRAVITSNNTDHQVWLYRKEDALNIQARNEFGAFEGKLEGIEWKGDFPYYTTFDARRIQTILQEMEGLKANIEFFPPVQSDGGIKLASPMILRDPLNKNFIAIITAINSLDPPPNYEGEKYEQEINVSI